MILLSVIFNSEQSFGTGIKAYKSMYISPLTGIFLACFFKFSKRRAIVLLSCFAAVLFVNAFTAIVQAFYGISIEDRVIGFFNDKMLLAAAHMLILPATLAVLVFTEKLPTQLSCFYLATILINIPAVILANTRIVWIGLSIVYSLILCIGIKDKMKIAAGIFAMFIIAAVVIYANPISQNRLDSITNLSINQQTGYQSNRERLLMWQSAWQMFQDYPAFGVGVNNFYQQYRDKYKEPTAVETPWHAHNLILNSLAETGAVGSVGLIVLFIYLYYDVIRTWRKDKSLAAAVYFFSLFTFSINFLTDVLFCGHYLKMPTYIFWLITGIYLSFNKYIDIEIKNDNHNK
ncbi:O-antigen ligase family protein [Pectinatus haikarae]|uniref:O-antigen ligase n=2 Tax=Pectinatus haikarae TaxID=349096 RepID=A0ABT9YDB6_9FIRM|nr:O-antigen ligase family protein [Pectinatus haikarae]MDQ0205182.1 O-antigen ligase [Pectinatus haikarae]